MVEENEKEENLQFIYKKEYWFANAGINSSEIDVEEKIEEVDLEYLTEEIPNAIQRSLEGVERVSKIVRSMKEFSHPGGKEKTSVDINKTLESTITVARNEWKYVAEMETDFDPSLPLVSCLLGELNQVFLNLIVNLLPCNWVGFGPALHDQVIHYAVVVAVPLGLWASGV